MSKSGFNAQGLILVGLVGAGLWMLMKRRPEGPSEPDPLVPGPISLMPPPPEPDVPLQGAISNFRVD